MSATGATSAMNTAQVLVDRILSCDVGQFNVLSQEIKQERWKLRDSWLEASLGSEAQKNGLLSDHFVNFTDLFDAIIVNALLERLPLATSDVSISIPFFALLQLLLSENERVLTFFFLKPVVRDRSVLANLINYCPEMRKCINMLMDSIHECIHEDLQYFAVFISLLASKYPSQATLELCQFVLNEIRTVEQSESISESFEAIKSIFPFIDDTSVHYPVTKPIFTNKITLR
jgi:hypothetical protein